MKKHLCLLLVLVCVAACDGAERARSRDVADVALATPEPVADAGGVSPFGVFPPPAVCGDGFTQTGEGCDDGAARPNDGCSPTCQIEAGWFCQTAWNPDRCARTPTCGDGNPGPNEDCDDGQFNSDEVPDACRQTCKLPWCGDGVEDSGETCDDGAGNGKQGFCAFGCQGYLPYQTHPAATGSYDLVPMPAGSIMLIASNADLAPLDLTTPLDLADFAAKEAFLASHGFFVGRIMVAGPGGFDVKNPMFLVDDGFSAYENLRAVMHDRGEAVVAELGWYRVSAGERYLDAGYGGGVAPACCATGPSAAFDRCGFQPGAGLPPDPCNGPFLCPEPWDALGAVSIDDLSPLGSPAAGPAELDMSCNHSCWFAGSALSDCSDPTSGYIPEQSNDAHNTCRATGPQLSELCLHISAGGLGGVLNCPGYCEGQSPESLCGWLEPKEGTPGRVDQCGIASSVELLIDQGGDCTLENDPWDNNNAQEFSDFLASQLWRHCIDGGGGSECGSYQPGGTLVDVDDVVMPICAAAPDFSGALTGRCLFCSTAAGGACFPGRPSGEDLDPLAAADSVWISPVADEVDHARQAATAAVTVAQMRSLLKMKRAEAVADPVVAASGELTLSSLDVAFPSRGVPFEFHRSYRSGGARSGALGPGWNHNFEERLEPIGDMENRVGLPAYCVSALPEVHCILHHDGYGGTSMFVFDPNTGIFVPNPGSSGTIVATFPTRPEDFPPIEDGVVPVAFMHLPGGITKAFDLSGVLLSAVDAMGFGVTLNWTLLDAIEVETGGAWSDAASLRLADVHERSMAAARAHRDRMNRLNRLELTSVVDSANRTFTFQYQTYFQNLPVGFINVDGPYRRKRLASVAIDHVPLVSFSYVEEPTTSNAYLTRATRTGVTNALTNAEPLVTEYEYAHALISGAGALAPRQYVPDSPLGNLINTTFNTIDGYLAACSGALTIDLSPTGLRDACGKPAITTTASGGALNIWPLVWRQLADNIIRVRRGGTSSASIDLETLYEVDPRRADFDRVLSQRYGAVNAVLPVPAPVSEGGSVVFHWLTAMPQFSIFATESGDPDGLGCTTTSEEIECRSTWFTSGKTVPDELETLIPLAAHAPLPPESRTVPGACTADAVDQVPMFAARHAAGARTDESLTTAPTILGSYPAIKRTPETCEAVAARHARDAFINDVIDVGALEKSGVAPGKHRERLAWDLALVCRWVTTVDRVGATRHLGLNFMGMTLVEATPSPTGAGLAVTRRIFNPDGNVTEERRPDGGKTALSYVETGDFAATVFSPGSTMMRHLVASVVELPATSGAELEQATLDNASGAPIAIGQRNWSYTYEPLFQQILTETAPDGLITQFAYDWQQLGSSSVQADRLTNRMHDFTGRPPQELSTLFLARDLDGDGTSGVERSSGLVLTWVDAVDLGGGTERDVGVRYVRDTRGQLIGERRIEDDSNPNADKNYTDYTYYRNYQDAVAGTLVTTTSDNELGPLALVRHRRTVSSTAGNDLLQAQFAYDALGGVRSTVENGDAAQTTTTVRDSLGQVIYESRPGGLEVQYDYDARGQLIVDVAHDALPGAVTPDRVTTYAWGAGGVALGSCTDITSGACLGFQAWATEAVRRFQLGQAPPTSPPAGATFSVRYVDREDRPMGGIDAEGGETVLERNPAGLVIATETNGTPLIRTSAAYDNMGRVVRRGNYNLRESFIKYDTLGRVVGVQELGALGLTSFTSGTGQIARTRYDLLDRPVVHYTEARDGTNTPKTFDIVRRVLNKVGGELFVHRYAAATVPATLPAPPAAAITTTDGWATEEMRFDPLMRPVYHRAEGHTTPTTAQWDGLGLDVLVGLDATVDINDQPASRVRTLQRTAAIDGAGAVARQSTTTLRFDGAGRIVEQEQVDPSNSVVLESRRSYDGLGQLVSARDQAGRTQSVVYDPAGRVTTLRELGVDQVEERATAFEYDAMGRLTVETPADAPATTTEYDLAGRVLTQTSGAGSTSHVTTYEYDEVGRLATLSKHGGTLRTLSWIYGENRSRPDELRVDNTLVRTWIRDGLERPATIVDRNVVFAADADAALAGSRPELETDLTWDSLGRLLVDETAGFFPPSSPTLPGMNGVIISRATHTYAANYLGRDLTTTRTGERIDRNYSARGNLTGLIRTNTTSIGAAARTTSTTLSWEGGLWVRAATPSTVAGRSWRTEKLRDGLGRVTGNRLSHVATSTATLALDDVLRGPTDRITAERRTGTLSGTAVRGYRYDRLGRLDENRVDLAASMTQAQFLTSANIRGALLDEEFGAGVVSSPDAVSLAGLNDSDGLLSSTADDRARTFASTYNTTAAGAPPTTVNGRIITLDGLDRVESDKSLEYEYDVLDRLVRVRGAAEELRLAYDGLGRRKLELRRVTASTTQDVVLEYDGANVIEETITGSSLVVATTTHAPGIDAPLIAAAGPTRASVVPFILGTNARGDVVSAARENASVLVEEQLLDPWGERTLFLNSTTACVEGVEGGPTGSKHSLPQATCAPNALVLGRFGIGGARAHPRTKLVDLRNRVYATHLRGFLTRDPLGNIDSNGLWNYVAGDPINLRDPWGLEAQEGGTCAQGQAGCVNDVVEKPWWQGVVDVVSSMNPLQEGGATFDGDEAIKGVLGFLLEDAPTGVQAAAAAFAGAASAFAETLLGGASFIFPALGSPVPTIDPTLSPSEQLRSVNPFAGVQQSFEAAANAQGDATIDRYYDAGRGMAGSAQIVFSGAALGRGMNRRLQEMPPGGSARHRITDINPSGSRTNCANCTIATDATLAGRPAVALPGDLTMPATLEKHFGRKFAPATESLIRSHLQGESGRRGVVYGVRADGTAHYFNAVNQAGEVKYLDGQAGTVTKGSVPFAGYRSIFFMITN